MIQKYRWELLPPVYIRENIFYSGQVTLLMRWQPVRRSPVSFLPPFGMEIYFVLENPVLWAGSELIGSAVKSLAMKC
jgi:hypothetical protein